MPTLARGGGQKRINDGYRFSDSSFLVSRLIFLDRFVESSG